MRCAWEAYLSLVPLWLRPVVDKEGRDGLQELRLRLGQPPELILNSRSLWGDKTVTRGDISFCINAASRYSPWSAATSAQGYITAPGGHRIGISGDAVAIDNRMTGVREPRYLCMRVARDFPGLAARICPRNESVLIVGPPGSGKTTFLRDLIRQISDCGPGSVGVVDERGELFPVLEDQICFPAGKRTDILTGCAKYQGIETILRTMGPSVIAVDEITAQQDCAALIHAGWCGVRLLATAHAHNRQDLYSRSVYRPLLENGLFDRLIVLSRDKSLTQERIMPCT